MKVYVVSTGEYSDYHICEIFSKRKLAEQYIKEMSKWYGRYQKDYAIGIYNVDKPVSELKIIQVHMDKEGNTTTIFHTTNDTIGFQCFDYEKCLVWNVNTDNDDTAVKVANEKRIQILAKDIWGSEKKCREMFR